MRLKRISGVLGCLLVSACVLPNAVKALNVQDVLDDFTSKYVKDDTIYYNSIKPIDNGRIGPYDYMCNSDFDNNILYPYNRKMVDDGIVSENGNKMSVSVTECNEEFSKCFIRVGEEGSSNNPGGLQSVKKEVNIKWAEPNQKVKAKIEAYNENLKSRMESCGDNSVCYKIPITDLNLINYFHNNGSEHPMMNDDLIGRTVNFSNELRKIYDNSNISFKVDLRSGREYSFLETGGFGGLVIEQDNIIYDIVLLVGLNVDEILYVPSDTELTDDALIAAAKKRIKDTLGYDDIEITVGKPFTEYLDWKDEQLDVGAKADLTKTTNHSYTFNFGNFTTDFVIVADSSKMSVPEYLRKDIDTGVEVSLDNSSIPLDTSLQINRITSGDIYNRLMSFFNVGDNDTYDINLYSDLLGNRITKLNNGFFKVRFPLKDVFKNKNLAVYYLDENNNVVQYDVTVEDGYASFETNHFSIYTLAEKTSDEETQTTQIEEKATSGTVDNPQTGDRTELYIITLTLSFVALLGAMIGLKKKNMMFSRL